MKSVQGGEIFHSLTNIAVLKQHHKTLETCIKKKYFKILPEKFPIRMYILLSLYLYQLICLYCICSDEFNIIITIL